MTLRATAEGTAKYIKRFAGSLAPGHFRQSQNLWMSTIGLGSYLGNADEQTDEAYRRAVIRAVELGCNVVDSAANYRFQRSERSIGAALDDLFREGRFGRDEIVVSTKGGFIPFDSHQPRSRQEMMSYLEKTFIEPGICRWEDIVQGSHCMTAEYLAHQLDQSLRNLKLDCIDIYYIHNPESQLTELPREEFYKRLATAFDYLESAVQAGKIAMYGTATWNGYRAVSNSPDYLSLEEVVRTARMVGGDDHHFKVVQLPVNLAMTEALGNVNQTANGQNRTLLEAAADLEITVVASASMMQARLAYGLPVAIAETFPGLSTDAQRAIQFTRSTPGVTTALVGMSSLPHVDENMEVAAVPPASQEDYLKLFIDE